ncbi:conserved hypothetical protein [Hyphomicrobium sp. GJ21]|uniref:hypothetical protein n=1 Tax=Hyphomicrobium sp. GJ21 TaxID=113574 RepID=UPI000622B90A|nr:hypothetical protein [Hyphomicrobium sp. GJ21]CEJ88134.1 conserved hypothetical protein [Hyphomicrobium sp. GJ21]
MLLRVESSDDGEVRVYTSRHASVVGYFADDGEGGAVFRMDAGELAFPNLITTSAYMSVRELSLREAGARLHLEPHEVEGQPFDRILAVADPTPRYRDHWSGRSRTRLPIKRPTR